MEQIRRTLTMLVGTASALSFAFFALVVEGMFFDGLGSDAWLGMIAMAVNLSVIWIVNNMHDGTPLKNLKVRWCANTLFYTMILMIMEALIYTLRNPAISESNAIMYEFGYAFAVVMALGAMYPDSERIRILSDKNVRYKGRRSYMLVTQSHLEKGLCCCTGHVIGNIRMLDQLNVYSKGMPVTKARVIQIHKDGDRLSDAKGGRNVTLILNLRKELHPYTVLSDVREAFTENMKQMLDAFRIWYNRYVEEERMYEIQREIYELCCKRDHILPESTHVEVCVGGIFVNAEKIEEGYRLTSEDSPAETFLADDMLDALSYLPEYLAIPEVIEEESIRMRAVDGR